MTGSFRPVFYFLSALPASFAVIELLFLKPPKKKKMAVDSVYAATAAAP